MRKPPNASDLSLRRIHLKPHPIAYWLTVAVSPAFALSPIAPANGPMNPPGITIPSPQANTLGQVGGLANIRVIDRTTGAALPIYEYQGEYWVVGTAGRNYAISMQRRPGAGRTLAVTSVDGINVISGQTAAYLQTGYVLSGYGAYEINGWRKSLQEVAAFTFAAPGDSYASKTGRAAHIGVIGVALFVEQQQRPLLKRDDLEQSGAARDRAEASNAPAAAPGPAPSAVPAPSAAASSSRSASESPAQPSAREASKASADLGASAQATLTPGLGTQHGQREVSVTQNVAFKRASTTPDEIIMIRYDSVENLLRRGVLAYAQPLQINPPTARAFPSSVNFVPDPPRW